MSTDTPYNEFSTVIKPDWIDYNGHLNVAFYHYIFDLSARPFFQWMGMTKDLRKEYNFSTFALETHLNYMSEVKVDATVRVESRLLDVNEKRFHFYQEMFKTESDTLAASHESVGTIVNMASRKSTAMPAQLLEKLLQIKSAHEQLQRPWQIGHTMAVNSKPGQ